MPMLINHHVSDIYASCWTTVYERSLCFDFIIKRNKHKMKCIIQIKKFFDEWRTEWLDFRCCPTTLCLPHAVSSKIFFVFTSHYQTRTILNRRVESFRAISQAERGTRFDLCSEEMMSSKIKRKINTQHCHTEKLERKRLLSAVPQQI